MSLIARPAIFIDIKKTPETGDKSPSIRSILSSSTNRKYSRSSSSLYRALRLQAGVSIGIPTDLSDDENDFDDNSLARDNYRFAPQIIRTRRRSRHNSIQLPSNQQRYSRSSTRKSDLLVIQAPPPGNLPMPIKQNSIQHTIHPSIIDHQPMLFAVNSFKEIRGQTFLHLAARLGHDEILRLLISETSQASMLMNKKGQTPLLTAIEAGSTSTATLLMESDPRSIIASDNNGSSVFHYACEHCNDVVLHRAIALSKRLNSTSDRITVK
jgi:hypothetical protein